MEVTLNGRLAVFGFGNDLAMLFDKASKRVSDGDVIFGNNGPVVAENQLALKHL